jgi:hypothetical protein
MVTVRSIYERASMSEGKGAVIFLMALLSLFLGLHAYWRLSQIECSIQGTPTPSFAESVRGCDFHR